MSTSENDALEEKRVKKALVATITAVSILATTAGAALAADCVVANKPDGAGVAATFEVTTHTLTVTRSTPNGQIAGGFGTVTVNGIPITDSFVHAPDGVLPPTREGGPAYDCDGKGLDSIEACMGG